MAEKYKSQIREKIKARKKRTEGRSLANKTLADHTSRPSRKQDERLREFLTDPPNRFVRRLNVEERKEATRKLRERAKQSAVARVKEVISKKAKAVGKGLSEGLGDIRHPAQLIPAFRKGNFFADMIQKRTKK